MGGDLHLLPLIAASMWGACACAQVAAARGGVPARLHRGARKSSASSAGSEGILQKVCGEPMSNSMGRRVGISAVAASLIVLVGCAADPGSDLGGAGGPEEPSTESATLRDGLEEGVEQKFRVVGASCSSGVSLALWGQLNGPPPTASMCTTWCTACGWTGGFLTFPEAKLVQCNCYH